MKLARRRFLHLAAGAAALAGAVVTIAEAAWSQSTRTIKIVVPVPPGGALDLLVRLLAEQISRAQGPTIVIDNRPGANTVIGTEATARAAPDGNTLLTNAPAAFAITPHLRKLGYDPLKSFEPICLLVNFPMVIAVNSAVPYRTLDELLNAARAKPGGLTVASIGPASLAHIAFEKLKRAANVNITFVPYPGTAPAVNALLGEHVTSYFGNYTDVVEQINAGKLRVLATASRTRIAALPDLPTVAESGYGDYEFEGWFGLFAPAGTPKELVAKFAGWFSTAMQVPEVKAKLVAQGLYPVGMCGADFGDLLRKQYDEFGRLIREANIKAE
jgi:tripartite-type tricarboxylate transporter receptor subunit TctC